MLDEQAEKQRCISRIKNAYSINFHGNSPEVMDGSAENILRDKHIETGALKVEVKSEQEVKRERGEKKRVREGNGNLDSFVNTKRKAVVQGEE
jgi:cryptochrome